jgi:hypothetical protein
MTYIVGVAYLRGSATFMLNTEAFFAVGAIVVFLLVQKLLFKSKIKHAIVP